MLYVEGKTDEALLGYALRGPGSKLALSRRGTKRDPSVLVRQDRGLNMSVRYLRDRDFDHEPPAPPERGSPSIDHEQSDGVHGYRWVRHSIENYILDEQFAQAALGVDQTEWRSQLAAAADRIKKYQAGRWTIGQLREALPRTARLPTHPAALRGEFELPAGLDENATWRWINADTSSYRRQATPLLAESAVRTRFREYLARLNTLSIEDILLWHSGKDLLAALQSYLAGKGVSHPTEYVKRVIIWVQAHPYTALAFFPEWQALKGLLNT